MAARLTRGVIRPLSLALLIVALLTSAAAPALAAPIANSAFQHVWERTDRPVADMGIARTWMWGPSANTGPLQEAYAEAPGSMRLVQYFDKSRMEINDPNGDPNSPWYVTNGLLANELISGDMQFGDATFRHFGPAAVDVAGDPSDPNSPTYASFSGVLNAPPAATGSVVEQQLNRDGTVQLNVNAAGSYHVIIAAQSSATNHSIALPFWNFMNSTGIVYENGGYQQDQLFINPYYATGYPISEPYWTSVLVGGALKDVLVQCFQRRCLTYTPSNPAGWQVESGNIGQHYYYWRYTILGNPQPIPQPNPNVEVSAWVSSPSPLHNEDVTVYGKLLDAGQPVAGVALTATWHFQSGDVSCSSTTDASGVGYCQRNVGSAEADVPVPIDISFSYQGVTYTAHTSLTPTGQLPSNVEIGAWVSNSNPKQHTVVTVYGQLTQGGHGVAAIPMTATWSFDSSTQTCTGTTNTGGVASCSLDIGSATIGYQVEIWVSLDFDGHVYTARTSITPSS